MDDFPIFDIVAGEEIEEPFSGSGGQHQTTFDGWLDEYETMNIPPLNPPAAWCNASPGEPLVPAAVEGTADHPCAGTPLSQMQFSSAPNSKNFLHEMSNPSYQPQCFQERSQVPLDHSTFIGTAQQSPTSWRPQQQFNLQQQQQQTVTLGQTLFSPQQQSSSFQFFSSHDQSHNNTGHSSPSPLSLYYHSTSSSNSTVVPFQSSSSFAFASPSLPSSPSPSFSSSFPTPQSFDRRSSKRRRQPTTSSVNAITASSTPLFSPSSPATSTWSIPSSPSLPSPPQASPVTSTLVQPPKILYAKCSLYIDLIMIIAVTIFDLMQASTLRRGDVQGWKEPFQSHYHMQPYHVYHFSCIFISSFIVLNISIVYVRLRPFNVECRMRTQGMNEALVVHPEQFTVRDHTDQAS